MTTLVRPIKVGNVHTYVAEVNALAPADAPIKASEVDADFDTLYAAFNALPVTPWHDNGSYILPNPGTDYPIYCGPITLTDTAPGGPTIQMSTYAIGSTPLITMIHRASDVDFRALPPAEILGSLAGYGSDGTADIRGGQITWRTAESWTPTAHGTNYEIATMPIGGTALQNRILVNATGYTTMPSTLGLRIGDTTNPRERLDVAGALIVGAATAATPVDGTVQYTGTDLQGRVGGAWVNLTAEWHDTGTYLVPNNGTTYPMLVGQTTITNNAGGANIQLYTLDAINAPLITMIRRPALTGFPAMPNAASLGALAYYGSDGTTDVRGGQLIMRTAEVWTSIAHGTNYEISTALLGTTTMTQRLVIKASGVTVMPATNGLRIGDATDPRERLDVFGAVVLGASTAATPVDGTLQYTGAKFQGRVAGGWIDIPGAAGGGGAPSGAAGGDLAGSSYPNPVVAPLAITTGKLADGAVGNLKISDVAWAKLTGVPATFAPGGSATGDLSGSYPNPTVVKAAGNFQWGGAAPLTRGQLTQTADTCFIMVNNPFLPQDPSLPSWDIQMALTAGFSIDHRVGGAASGSQTSFLSINAAGACTLAGNLSAPSVALTAGNAPVQWGNGTVKGRLLNGTAIKSVELSTNATNAGVQDDPTAASWRLMLDASSDTLQVNRQPAGSTTPATVFRIRNTSASNYQFAPSANISAAATFVDLEANVTNTLAYDSGKAQMQLRLDYTSNIWTFYSTPSGGALSVMLRVDSAGNLAILGPNATKASGTVWINPSDPRLKRDVAAYTAGLEAIERLAPITFCYNGRGGTVDDGRACYGLDASVVQEILPECVGTRLAKLDPDDAEETELLTLDASNVTWALVNAVKTLAARVAALEGTR
jgi:hypothetical protein